MTVYGLYLICELGEDKEVLHILDQTCTAQVEAMQHMEKLRAAPPNSIHHVEGPMAIYRRIVHG